MSDGACKPPPASAAADPCPSPPLPHAAHSLVTPQKPAPHPRPQTTPCDPDSSSEPPAPKRKPPSETDTDSPASLTTTPGSRHGGQKKTPGSSSPNPMTHLPASPVPPNMVPRSERQQLALLKQMTDASSPHADSLSSSPDHQQHPGSGGGGGGCQSSTRKRSKLYKRNMKGETSLHLAAKKGDAATVTELIHQGVDVNIKDNAGWAPLHEACCKGHLTVARILLQSGAAVDVAGVDGDTPLHDTASRALYDVTLLLLKHGAHPSKPNQLGVSAIDVAPKEDEVYSLLTMDPSRWADLPLRSVSPGADAIVAAAAAAAGRKGVEPGVDSGGAGSSSALATSPSDVSSEEDTLATVLHSRSPSAAVLRHQAAAAAEGSHGVTSASSDMTFPPSPLHAAAVSALTDEEDENASSPGQLFIDEDDGVADDSSKSQTPRSKLTDLPPPPSKADHVASATDKAAGRKEHPSEPSKVSSVKPPEEEAVSHPRSDVTRSTHRSSDVTRSPHRSSDVTRSPHRSSDVTRSPQRSSDVTRSPHRSSDVTRSPHRSSDVTRSPHRSSDVTRSPHRSSDVTRSPHRSSDVTRSPQRSSDVTRSPHRSETKKKHKKHKHSEESESSSKSGSNSSQKKKRHRHSSGGCDDVTRKKREKSSDSCDSQKQQQQETHKTELPAKTAPLKKTLKVPLKIDTKMKYSVRKNDDDRLFKPDTVIKSPKLSPKKLDKPQVSCPSPMGRQQSVPESSPHPSKLCHERPQEKRQPCMKLTDKVSEHKHHDAYKRSHSSDPKSELKCSNPAPKLLHEPLPDSEKKQPDSEKKQPESEKKHPDSEKKQPDCEKKQPDSEKKQPDSEKKQPDSEKKQPDSEKKQPDSEKKQPDSEKKQPDSEKKQPDSEKKQKKRKPPPPVQQSAASPIGSGLKTAEDYSSDRSCTSHPPAEDRVAGTPELTQQVREIEAEMSKIVLETRMMEPSEMEPHPRMEPLKMEPPPYMEPAKIEPESKADVESSNASTEEPKEEERLAAREDVPVIETSSSEVRIESATEEQAVERDLDPTPTEPKHEPETQPYADSVEEIDSWSTVDVVSDAVYSAEKREILEKLSTEAKDQPSTDVDPPSTTGPPVEELSALGVSSAVNGQSEPVQGTEQMVGESSTLEKLMESEDENAENKTGEPAAAKSALAPPKVSSSPLDALGSGGCFNMSAISPAAATKLVSVPLATSDHVSEIVVGKTAVEEQEQTEAPDHDSETPPEKPDDVQETPAAPEKPAEPSESFVFLEPTRASRDVSDNTLSIPDSQTAESTTDSTREQVPSDSAGPDSQSSLQSVVLAVSQRGGSSHAKDRNEDDMKLQDLESADQSTAEKCGIRYPSKAYSETSETSSNSDMSAQISFLPRNDSDDSLMDDRPRTGPRRRKKPAKFTEQQPEKTDSPTLLDRRRTTKRVRGTTESEDVGDKTMQKSGVQGSSSSSRRKPRSAAAAARSANQAIVDDTTSPVDESSRDVPEKKTPGRPPKNRGRGDRSKEVTPSGRSTPVHEQPPIILKISTSTMRSASPVQDEGETAEQGSSSLVAERAVRKGVSSGVSSSAHASSNETSDDNERRDDGCSSQPGGGGKAKMDKNMQRVTRTLRSNAHLKAVANAAGGGGGDTSFLNNDDSNSSSCSNDSSSRLKQAGSSANTSADLPIATAKEEPAAAAAAEVKEEPLEKKPLELASEPVTSADQEKHTSSSAQHPKRRKMAKHKLEAEQKASSILEVPPIKPPDDKFINSINTFNSLRRKIRARQKAALPQVPPKVQPYVNDFYLVKKHYLIEGHKNNYPRIRSAPALLEQYPDLKLLFEKQEKERNKMRIQQMIERERLEMVAEAETLRICTRSALAEKSQSSNLSACQILAEQHVYNVNTDTQLPNGHCALAPNGPRACSVRVGRHNNRQLQAIKTENDEKLQRMKSHMVTRHRHEADALRASQSLEWIFRAQQAKPPNPGANTSVYLSEAVFVPRVDVSAECVVPAWGTPS